MNNLLGQETPDLVYCDKCETWKPRSEFYPKSKRDSKFPGDVRQSSGCKPCYLDNNGKVHLEKYNYQPSNTLDMFLNDGESECQTNQMNSSLLKSIDHKLSKILSYLKD